MRTLAGAGTQSPSRSAVLIKVNSKLIAVMLCKSLFFHEDILRHCEGLFETMVDIYVVDGDLDADGVKANLSVFSELAHRKEDVTIDMSSVERIDGSGVGALVFLYKRLRAAGHQIRLTKVRSQPLSVLNKLGVSVLFSARSDGAFIVERAADGGTKRVGKAGSESSHVRPTA